MEYKCKICKKLYKSYQSLWNHNNRYHITNENKMQTLINFSANKMTTFEKTKLDNTKDDCVCKYCNKILSHRNSRWRHEKICTKKINIEKQLDDINKKLEIIEKKHQYPIRNLLEL